MFSVDYPFGSMAEARTFLQQLSLGEEDRDRIAHSTPKSCFRL
jgi:hypothetical protein